jgi:hypothetical protein
VKESGREHKVDKLDLRVPPESVLPVRRQELASARESRRECWVDELEWPPESAGRGGGGVGGGEPTKMEQRWRRWRRIEPLDPRVRVRRIEGTSWVFTRAQ